MTKKNDKQLIRDLLDHMAEFPNISKACARFGIAQSTFWAWCASGAVRTTWPHDADDPNAPEITLTESVKLAHRFHTAHFLGVVRSRIVHGDERKLFENGRPVWRVDAKIASDAMTMDDETWALCYAPRARGDTFARDENGALIQETVFDPPPAHLQIRAADKLLGWSETKTVNQNVSGGVRVIGDRPAPRPLPIEHAAPVAEAVEDDAPSVMDAGDIEAGDGEQSADDLSGDDIEADATDGSEASEASAASAEVGAPPMAAVPAGKSRLLDELEKRGSSPLLDDLRRRARELLLKGPANPLPIDPKTGMRTMPNVVIGRPADEPAQP